MSASSLSFVVPYEALNSSCILDIDIAFASQREFATDLCRGTADHTTDEYFRFFQQFLSSFIKKALSGWRPTPEVYCFAYSCVYTLCTSKVPTNRSEQVYRCVTAELAAQIATVKHAATVKHVESAIKQVNGFCTYVNRFYAPRRELPTIGEAVTETVSRKLRVLLRWSRVRDLVIQRIFALRWLLEVANRLEEKRIAASNRQERDAELIALEEELQCAKRARV